MTNLRPRARSSAHGVPLRRYLLHATLLATTFSTVLFARSLADSGERFPVFVPAFSLSGVAGVTWPSGPASVFRPSATTGTLPTAASSTRRSESNAVAAGESLVPPISISAGVSAAAAGLGEVEAGIKPLADIVDRRVPMVEYRIRTGDSLGGIAALFGISISTLLANNLTLSEKNIDLIPSDAVLIVPLRDGILHKVSSGDTVAKVVAQYDNVTVNTVLAYRPNNIQNANLLEEGRFILLPDAVLKPPPPPPPPAAPPGEPAGPGRPEQPPAPTGGGRFATLPLAGWSGISDPFGVPRGGGTYHTGIDLDMYGRPYSPTFSVCDGLVSKTEYLTYSYGYHVIVDCGGGWTTLYAHLSSISVSPGQRVAAGSPVGMTGNTGFSTGHHLHFEIRFEGGFLNPALYLPF